MVFLRKASNVRNPPAKPLFSLKSPPSMIQVVVVLVVVITVDPFIHSFIRADQWLEATMSPDQDKVMSWSLKVVAKRTAFARARQRWFEFPDRASLLQSRIAPNYEVL